MPTVFYIIVGLLVVAFFTFELVSFIRELKALNKKTEELKQKSLNKDSKTN